jgi:hypothetical protein
VDRLARWRRHERARPIPTVAELLDRVGLTPHVVRDEDLDATAVIGDR